MQGFIQAICVSGKYYEKLNLLIEFTNLDFIKFYFKAYWSGISIQIKLAKFVLF